jgi:4,5-DOPA dioxygenase extradiol
LVRGLDAATHISLGKALNGLLGENLLIIGSGFSFHNMSAFSWDSIGAPDPANDAFQDWLIETCTGESNEEVREKLLVEWENAPSARYCHPREEHLLPLHVCQGMAGSAAELIFDDQILGKRSVGFLWQAS